MRFLQVQEQFIHLIKEFPHFIWVHGSSAPAEFDSSGGALPDRLPFIGSNSTHFDLSVTSHWKPLQG